jgi:DNA-binding MarR family transcriptional regulator
MYMESTPELEQDHQSIQTVQITRRLAKQLGLRLIRAYRFLRQREQDSLTLSQAVVLDLLGDERQWRVSELAEFAGIRQPSMTDLIHRMERQGLLCKVQSLHDKRSVEVTITDEGRSVLRATNRRHVDNMSQRLALLSDEEKEVLERALPIFDILFGAPDTSEH